MAREIKAPETLAKLVTLIHSKFPRSQAIYDAALLTWRIMADSNTQVDWHEEFCPDGRLELRNRPQYSTLIAFGMCVARPDKTHYFLHDWPPLRRYIVLLGEEPSPENAEKIRAIDKAYVQLESRTHQPGTAIPNSPIEIVRNVCAGTMTVFSKWLNAADQQAKNAQRTFPYAANDELPPDDGLSEQAVLKSGMLA